MVSQKDIYTSAKLLIKKYGDEAEEHAFECMMRLIADDDAKGSAVWLSILGAIKDLSVISKPGKLH